MDHNDENNRRFRDEQDNGEDILATVKKAKEFIDLHIVTEAEALKYFNLSKAIFDKYIQVLSKP